MQNEIRIRERREKMDYSRGGDYRDYRDRDRYRDDRQDYRDREVGRPYIVVLCSTTA